MAATSTCGSADLQLPENLRGPMRDHLANLREAYRKRGCGGRVGFGTRPAVIVIDLAKFWTTPTEMIGSNLDPVIENTVRVLAAARKADVPIFFSTWDCSPDYPPSPHDKKLAIGVTHDDASRFALDPRLERRPNEKLIRKRYASCFKGTNFHEMLTALGVDTLIVTGCSTSHCVYATCRDATDSFRVIVPKEAVGERCEIMHEVNLLDIDIDLGDVMPLADVVKHLQGLPAKK